MKHKVQILQESAEVLGPLCVGLDTDPSYLPPSVLSGFRSPAQAVLAYNKELIKGIAQSKSACCFKIQIAYYEAMGLEGLAAYAETLKAARKSGLPVISDVKRGDIAATAAAYARAHFSGDFETDIITVNPYMGFDTLLPFTEYCSPSKGGKGVFVLLRTSNPGTADIEQKELKSGKRVLDAVGDGLLSLCGEWKKDYPEETCFPIGAVVGCTGESDASRLRKAYPDIFFLIPGYGAQGGAARIAAALLQNAGGTVNSSRAVLCAWKKDKNLERQRNDGTLSLDDIVKSAVCAAEISKKELLAAKADFLH
ncbi:orotidine-5'-phosphate decarboxylase [Treponema parvum]|uniref:Orotidine 5'-phosphate decarboxylase n=1 Tax=Treponema parvum TaxID=138851 RepID=A0A975IBN0_9SPIR|nr:orotidine-5'-phosphate decarboxylase [Treponema parvum]QTQ10978.1 orotidine-5'-phosphate decarboxylase [Treponema parvum]